MSLDYIQPIVGALYHPDSVSIFDTTAPASPTATGALSAITWPLSDFATLPKALSNLSVSSYTSTKDLYVRLNYSSAITVYGLLCDLRSTWGITSTRLYYWDEDAAQYQTWRLTAVRYEARESGRPRGLSLMVPASSSAATQTSTSFLVPLYFIDGTKTAATTTIDIGCGELGLGIFANLPTSPIQSTFTLTPTQQNTQTFTCQNGRQIQYYSSTQTFQLNASHTWSDDGTTADNLMTISQLRLTSGCPLVYANTLFGVDETSHTLPATAPVYLVNSAINPVTRGDGTTYSTTISGVTQP